MKNIVEETRQMNKMGTADIKKLMLSMGLPMIVSMALQAVTAYGIYYKIQQFVFFAAFGMNNAMIPIIAFNYGMRSKKRINQGIRYGMIYTLIIMILGAVLLQVFANQILGIFSLSEKTRELAAFLIALVMMKLIGKSKIPPIKAQAEE